MKPAPDIQSRLLDQIRDRLPNGRPLHEALCDVLHISYDSAYRRIRNETALVIEEVVLLANHFQLSLDMLFNDSKQVLFQSINLEATDTGFKNYLENIRSILQQLQTLQEVELVYLSKDLPFFYNFLFPSVFAFHYFFWMKSTLSHPDLIQRKYDPGLLPNEIRELGREVLQAYHLLPVTEICNSEMMHSLMYQIDYYQHAGWFEKDAHLQSIYNDVLLTANHMRKQAALGKRFMPGSNPVFQKQNYQLYFNRTVLGDNTILVRSSAKRFVYLNHAGLDYMVTSNFDFCRATENMIENLIRQSTLLSVSNEKQRNMFFNQITAQVPADAA